MSLVWMDLGFLFISIIIILCGLVKSIGSLYHNQYNTEFSFIDSFPLLFRIILSSFLFIYNNSSVHNYLLILPLYINAT